MRFILLLIIWQVAIAAYNDSTKAYLDPTNADDNALMWKHLFLKLNMVKSGTENLAQSIADVSKRLDDLTKRLDYQETLLKKSFNNSQRWTTILRRQDGSVDFNRNWNDYSNGFGNPNGDYFMGLQRIHELTTYGPPQELLIILKNFKEHTRYAKYESFRIGSAEERYALLELQGYSGNAGNDLGAHRGKKFSTPDRDNDDEENRNCALYYQSGWWFYGTCYVCNLNGLYRQENQSNNWGISWNSFGQWDHSLKYAEMMVRPKL